MAWLSLDEDDNDAACFLAHVIEIDASQLRFDAQESAEFLLELKSLPLNRADVHQLWTTTDGWVAALQLASLSLQDSRDAHQMIRGFSGRHHSISEYLAENVLHALPEELSQFLITTSICDRMCGDLAAAVSGQANGQALLEELERRDLFLRPLDEDREWFRYHHLFADFLRRRLQRDHPDRVSGLHIAAAEWFASRGHLVEAVTHFLAAGQPRRAVDLVEREAMYLVEHSRMASLLLLVNKLPAQLLAERSHLQIAIAWANCLLHRSGPAEVALTHVRRALSDDSRVEARQLVEEADVVQACIDIYGDRLDRVSELVQAQFGEGSKRRPWPVAVSANIDSFVSLQNADYRAAQDRQGWARESLDMSAMGPFAAVYGHCFDGLASMAEVDIARAERQFATAVALGRERAGRYSHAARLAGSLVGCIHYERNQLDLAAALLDECRELGGESGVADFMIATYITLARIRVLDGQDSEAWLLLHEAEEASRQNGLARLAAAVDAERVRMHVAAGDLDSAALVLRQRTREAQATSSAIARTIRHHELLMRARLASGRGHPHDAVDLLAQAQRDARDAPWPLGHLMVTVELAGALWATGQRTEAWRQVIPAISQAEAAGLLRTVIDAGPALLAVLRTIRDQEGRHPLRPYLDRVLATAAEDAAPPTTGGAHALSARAVAIVQLLAGGLTNKEIADRLGLTVNTVKWYLKDVYLQLGVTRRTECVAEARRLGLLA